MIARAWPCAALVLVLAMSARAQAPVRSAPLALRGFVHRIVRFGCGQGWSAHVASSDITLDVDRASHARLFIDARIVDGYGGVSLVDGAGPYRGETQRTLSIEWRGRARTVGDALVIRLGALRETAPVPGSTSGVVITNRATEEAVLTCVHEEHELLHPSRPVSLELEASVAHRAIVSCRFEPIEHEAPLPRPVRDVLTMPFYLDEGTGVTTDASYAGAVTDAAEYLVAREAGWVDGD